MPLWLPTSAALFAYLAGEKQLKIGAHGGRRTTARWSVSGDSTGGSKGFCQANVDRVGNISENPNIADGSEGGLVNGCRATGSDLSAHSAQPGDRRARAGWDRRGCLF